MYFRLRYKEFSAFFHYRSDFFYKYRFIIYFMIHPEEQEKIKFFIKIKFNPIIKLNFNILNIVSYDFLLESFQHSFLNVKRNDFAVYSHYL